MAIKSKIFWNKGNKSCASPIKGNLQNNGEQN